MNFEQKLTDLMVNEVPADTPIGLIKDMVREMNIIQLNMLIKYHKQRMESCESPGKGDPVMKSGKEFKNDIQ